MRYFLLDRITELVLGERARGIKCVTLTDPTLHDHFPDHPILPGVLAVEAAAQLAGFLIEISEERAEPLSDPRRALLAKIDRTKFYRPAEPGDRIELLATLDRSLEGAARVDVEASIDGERSMRGQLTFMMRSIASDRVHEQRRALYRLWTKGLDLPVPIP
ncbi:MAG: beta-hydroxyacyl-ACP dehydratase [Myxococcales bacterium]|nr:beta-hydroxyacyl-ACP dehydratase [Myxococcales bacterium]